MSNNNDNDELLLLAKIDILLHNNSTSASATRSNEQWLVGLVLLTRVHDDDEICSRLLNIGGDNNTEQQWHNSFREFLFQQVDQTTTTPSAYCYARLVAQLLYRICGCSCSDTAGTAATATGATATTTTTDHHTRRRKRKQQIAETLLSWLEQNHPCSSATPTQQQQQQQATNGSYIKKARLEILVALQRWMETMLIIKSNNSSDDDIPNRLNDVLSWLVQDVIIIECSNGNDDKKHKTKTEQEEETRGGVGNGTQSLKEEDVLIDKDDTSPPDVVIMEQTLDALLDETSVVHQLADDDDDYYLRWLSQCLLSLGKHIMVQTNNRLPDFFPLLLEQQLHHKIRRRLAPVLLELIREAATAAAADPSSKNIIPSFLETGNGSVRDDIVRFLLACVVSVADDDDSDDDNHDNNSDTLRATAWTVIVTLLHQWGWDWIWSSTEDTNSQRRRFGRYSYMCAAVRLASGEWNIQLSAVMSSKNQNDDDISESDETRGMLIEACAHVLKQTIEYMVGQVDDDEFDGVVLPGDVILHLRRSLKEALNSAVQFLGSLEGPTPSSNSMNEQVESNVIRLLASLLTEMDVFDPSIKRRYDNNDDEEDFECAALQALHVALERANSSIGVEEHLLPCLAAVLASSEGTTSRVQLLQRYGLLGEPLQLFLERYWNSTRTATTTASVLWACQVIELLFGMDIIIQTERLQASIIGFIQRKLRDATPSYEISRVLSSVVGCYVMLQGDDPPGEPDATIIQHAFELCARCEAQSTAFP